MPYTSAMCLSLKDTRYHLRPVDTTEGESRYTGTCEISVAPQEGIRSGAAISGLFGGGCHILQQQAAPH